MRWSHLFRHSSKLPQIRPQSFHCLSVTQTNTFTSFGTIVELECNKSVNINVWTVQQLYLTWHFVAIGVKRWQTYRNFLQNIVSPNILCTCNKCMIIDIEYNSSIKRTLKYFVKEQAMSYITKTSMLVFWSVDILSNIQRGYTNLNKVNQIPVKFRLVLEYSLIHTCGK